MDIYFIVKSNVKMTISGTRNAFNALVISLKLDVKLTIVTIDTLTKILDTIVSRVFGLPRKTDGKMIKNDSRITGIIVFR